MKTTPENSYDLALAADRKRFEGTDALFESTDLFSYLESGEAEAWVRFKDCTIFSSQSHWIVFVEIGNVLFFRNVDTSSPGIGHPFDAADRKKLLADFPEGVILPWTEHTRRRSKGVKAPPKHLLLANGDETGVLVEQIPLSLQKVWPTVSFRCLTMLANGKKTSSQKEIVETAYSLARGRISVLDFIPDERRKFTTQEKKAFKKNLPPTPPPGFTAVGGEWHRSATVLFLDGDKNKYYLLGQDDGSYFGVELPEPARTVDEAFKVLIPKEIRRKEGVCRQGEWFIVPVAEKVVPPVERCLATGWDVDLPRDDSESNRHTITGDVRIGEGEIYACRASLTHSTGDHVTQYFRKWVKFVRNTAVRSVSVEGVD